ncbi:MAG: tryptophan synthase subunit alpha [Cardiobacteriaceae bacterium]|nr:tryptophan synthase subunit alpha [Cardiobacteriaceae bacterium]
MTRLSKRFAELHQQSRKALIPYISAGDPDPKQTADILHALVAGSADVLELGIPFSDPAADGETIQQANERALSRGVTLKQTLNIVHNFRQKDSDTPIVLMGYLNSFERAGFAQTMADIQQAGGDAVILVDCPVEALPDYDAELQAHNITPIMLIAPTTTATRRKNILQHATGFLYFVSLRGVTGTQLAAADAIAADVKALKAETTLPVCIGFGIRDGKTARAMAELADGIVIGSALVAHLHATAKTNGNLPAAAQTFISDIRAHLDH